jgi:hypothetical protein
MFAGVFTAVRDRFSEFVVGATLATVAVVTGFISYTHISALTEHVAHQSWKTAHLMPFAVDGQIVIGSVYFMENAGLRRRWLGLIGIVPGVLESLYANWMSASTFGWHDAAWATVPAQAFACSTVLFERWLHARKSAKAASAEEESQLAAIRADNDGLRAALDAAAALADSALAALALRVAPEADRPEPAAPVAPAGSAVIGTRVPVVGPVMNLADRPKAAVPRQRPSAVPDTEDTRLPLPDDEDELRQLVNSLTRNKMFETYRVSKGKADKLRQQYLNDSEEVSARVA